MYEEKNLTFCKIIKEIVLKLEIIFHIWVLLVDLEGNRSHFRKPISKM